MVSASVYNCGRRAHSLSSRALALAAFERHRSGPLYLVLVLGRIRAAKARTSHCLKKFCCALLSLVVKENQKKCSQFCQYPGKALYKYLNAIKICRAYICVCVCVYLCILLNMNLTWWLTEYSNNGRRKFIFKPFCRYLSFILYTWEGHSSCNFTIKKERWEGERETQDGESLYIYTHTYPWRRAWLPTPVFLPGESHGQRSLAGSSPWSGKELDMTEQLSLHICTHP